MSEKSISPRAFASSDFAAVRSLWVAERLQAPRRGARECQGKPFTKPDVQRAAARPVHGSLAVRRERRTRKDAAATSAVASTR